MTPDEQPVMFEVDGHAGGLFAGSNRPAIDDGVLLSVDFVNFTLVLNIAVDAMGLRIGRSGLGFAGERDRGNNFAGIRVDHGRAIAAAVEGVNLLLSRLEEDGIGIRPVSTLARVLRVSNRTCSPWLRVRYL